jgi:hypothetical protein
LESQQDLHQCAGVLAMSFSSFSGSSRQKKVALGGRSKVEETRDQVVERTKLEREQRRQQKLEQRSATAIQVRRVGSTYTCELSLMQKRLPVQSIFQSKTYCAFGHFLFSVISSSVVVFTVPRMNQVNTGIRRHSGVEGMQYTLPVQRPERDGRRFLGCGGSLQTGKSLVPALHALLSMKLNMQLFWNGPA